MIEPSPLSVQPPVGADTLVSDAPQSDYILGGDILSTAEDATPDSGYLDRVDRKPYSLELASEPADALLNFFSPSSLAEAMASNGWSLAEEVAICVQIAQGAGGPKSTPSHQLQAMQYLNRRAVQSLKMSGALETKTATTTVQSASGTPIQLTTKVTMLASRVSSAMDEALAQGLAGAEDLPSPKVVESEVLPPTTPATDVLPPSGE